MRDGVAPFSASLSRAIEDRMAALRARMAKGINGKSDYWSAVGQHHAFTEALKIIEEARRTANTGPLNDR